MENTLIAELTSWNRQEQKFRELFSEDALKDREFQKMKLDEYDRLYRKYSGMGTTTDEKALLVMVRFQKRKLERTLYPGILTRLLRRGFLTLKHIVQRALRPRYPKNQPADYAAKTIQLPTENGPSEQQEPRRAVGKHRRYAHGLGNRSGTGHKKRNGRSI